ncbi:MAG: pentapeptide repeat-containing protein [Bacteroidetes bacterium]|nr:pentapeptide repeat-containing protein [Bacteroidota bacterium]
MDWENSTTNQNDSKKKSARIFLIYFSTLIYILITTASITDIQLILDDPVTLPIFNVDVSTTIFFLLSPTILLLLFVFYNLHYLHLKEISPKVGNYINWPVFEFSRFNSPKGLNGFLNFLQISLSNMVIWGLLPLTLLVISFRYLESHNEWIMWYHWSVSFLGICTAFSFWKRNYKFDKITLIISLLSILIISVSIYLIPILRYSKTFGVFLRDEILPNFPKDLKLFVLLIIFPLVISIFVATIQNHFLKKKWQNLLLLNIWMSLIIITFFFIHYIRHFPLGEGRNVNLSYQIISQNPDNPYEGVYSVNLRGKNLEGANIISSVLVNADLREANLQYSALYRSTLDSSNMTDAKLKCSDLHEASFKNTIMNGVDFRYANLIGVKHLTLKQLLITKTLYKAKLDPIWLKEKERNPRLYELHTTHPDSLLK